MKTERMHSDIVEQSSCDVPNLDGCCAICLQHLCTVVKRLEARATVKRDFRIMQQCVPDID